MAAATTMATPQVPATKGQLKPSSMAASVYMNPVLESQLSSQLLQVQFSRNYIDNK